MTPLDQISAAFAKGRPAFMPYFTLGYPDYATSLDVIEACAAAGADLMELGLPFSDPLADGPTIQHSTQVALAQGMSTVRALEAIRELRGRGVDIPLMLMGYYNPMLAHGLDRLASDGAGAGVNGFIVPDLPPEEASSFDAATRAHDLGLSYLVAPTSTAERLALVARRARGFTYLVSLTGVTGARSSLAADIAGYVARVRAAISTPLAVGFGISTPEQARAVGGLADGVIVGSKLIRTVGEASDPVGAAGEFVQSMVAALGG